MNWEDRSIYFHSIPEEIRRKVLLSRLDAYYEMAADRYADALGGMAQGLEPQLTEQCFAQFDSVIRAIIVTQKLLGESCEEAHSHLHPVQSTVQSDC